jgi:TetR/AcrR family transcriptional regulator, cholesterol catabolism regulator
MKKTTVRTYSNNENLITERRAQIVASAIHVFLENGYRGATTRQLAASLGMSEGNLYRYIGSKEDILHLICQTARQRGIEELMKVAQELSSKGSSQKDVLCECIKLFFQHCDAFQESNIFFSREISQFSHEDRQLLLQSQTDHVEFYEKLIQEGIKNGEFKTANPLLMAHNIVITGFDWGLRRWFLKKHFDLESYTAQNIEIIMYALSAKN